MEYLLCPELVLKADMLAIYESISKITDYFPIVGKEVLNIAISSKPK